MAYVVETINDSKQDGFAPEAGDVGPRTDGAFDPFALIHRQIELDNPQGPKSKTINLSELGNG